MRIRRAIFKELIPVELQIIIYQFMYKRYEISESINISSPGQNKTIYTYTHYREVAGYQSKGIN